MKPKTKITKEELLQLIAKVRRLIDIEGQVGINRHKNVAKDKRKERDKKRCRKKVVEND